MTNQKPQKIVDLASMVLQAFIIGYLHDDVPIEEAG